MDWWRYWPSTDEAARGEPIDRVGDVRALDIPAVSLERRDVLIWVDDQVYI